MTVTPISLEHLADEILLLIIRYLSVQDVIQLAKVSRKLANLTKDTQLWKYKYLEATGRARYSKSLVGEHKPILFDMLRKTWKALSRSSALNLFKTNMYQNNPLAFNITYSSICDNGKYLRYLFEVESHRDRFAYYPQSAQSLFRNFFSHYDKEGYPIERKSKRILQEIYNRLLLIMEVENFQNQGSRLGLEVNGIEISLSDLVKEFEKKQFDEIATDFWVGLDRFLERENTKKLIFTLTGEHPNPNTTYNDLEKIVIQLDNKILNLTDKGFSRLPKMVKNLKCLEILYFSEAKISYIPAIIGELKKLKELYLGMNRLSSLPTSIEKLSNLEELSLHSNHFLLFPEEIKKLPSLKRVNLNTNPNMLHDIDRDKKLSISMS